MLNDAVLDGTKMRRCLIKLERISVPESPLESSSLFYVSAFLFVLLLPLLSHLSLTKVTLYSRRVILWEALQFRYTTDGLWKLRGVQPHSGRIDRPIPAYWQ